MPMRTSMTSSLMMIQWWPHWWSKCLICGRQNSKIVYKSLILWDYTLYNCQGLSRWLESHFQGEGHVMWHSWHQGREIILSWHDFIRWDLKKDYDLPEGADSPLLPLELERLPFLRLQMSKKTFVDSALDPRQLLSPLILLWLWLNDL